MFLQKVRHIPHMILHHDPTVVGGIMSRNLLGREGFLIRHDRRLCTGDEINTKKMTKKGAKTEEEEKKRERLNFSLDT